VSIKFVAAPCVWILFFKKCCIFAVCCATVDVLLSATGHVKLTDFGTSTINDDTSTSPRTSFVGTQDYVSPEVLSGEKRATKACDLWALGCMVYQMLTGVSPFRAATEYLTFENIMGHCRGTQPIQFAPIITQTTQDLILSLLRQDDEQRIGAGEESGSNGYAALKAHKFFSGVQWGNLENLPAPYTPDPNHFPSCDNMRDGASDTWQIEGDPTPILSGPSQSEEDASVTVGSKWEQFLTPPERRVFTGLIYKRKVRRLTDGDGTNQFPGFSCNCFFFFNKTHFSKRV
jgi:serine/threonine protein kinase